MAGPTAVAAALERLRGERDRPPDASIVIPINARADLATVWIPLADIAGYAGVHTFEIVLVVNNYPPDEEPDAVHSFRSAAFTVVSVPDVWKPGEAVCLSARVPGIRAASSERVLLFDADCRLPNPTALLDWYVGRFERGADVAYTHVGFYDLRPLLSVRVKVGLHHVARATKRVLGVPTTRGSNYAVRRRSFLEAYDADLLSDDLNVGPTVKARGGTISYSGSRRLVVLTSGRTFQGGWARLFKYLRYRLLYNLRVIPVRSKTQRAGYHDTRLRS